LKLNKFTLLAELNAPQVLDIIKKILS